VRELESPIDTGIAIELTPPTLKGSTHHRDDPRRVTSEQACARCNIASPADLDRIRAQNIHRSGFSTISDISAWPMDII